MAKPFKENTLYFFRYKNPATKGLKVWDTAPLVIPLDVTSKSLLAVNIHWLKAAHRGEFVEYLMKYFSQQKIGKKRIKRTKLYYNFIKAGKLKWALIAIRRYHISRITGMKEIPKDEWGQILTTRSYRAKFKYNNWVKNLTRGFRNPTK